MKVIILKINKKIIGVLFLFIKKNRLKFLNKRMNKLRVQKFSEDLYEILLRRDEDLATQGDDRSKSIHSCLRGHKGILIVFFLFLKIRAVRVINENKVKIENFISNLRNSWEPEVGRISHLINLPLVKAKGQSSTILSKVEGFSLW